MMIKGFVAAIFSVLLLTGCHTIQNNPKVVVMGLIGAVLGALAESQISDGEGQLAAVEAGSLVDSWIGGRVDESLDFMDRLAMEQATRRALENNRSGTASVWYNPDSGNSGSIVPLRAYQTADGRNCRSFESTIIIKGIIEEILTSRVCRWPGYSWEIDPLTP